MDSPLQTRTPRAGRIASLALGIFLGLTACSDDPTPATGDPDAGPDVSEDVAADVPGTDTGDTGDTGTDCTGELGCPCAPDDSCEAGLVCEGAVCQIGPGLILAIEAGDARACDLRLETSRDVAAVFYPDDVRGELRTRDETSAIALMRTTDTALSGVIATVTFDGAEAPGADVISSLSATCYGRLGELDAAAIPAVQVPSE